MVIAEPSLFFCCGYWQVNSALCFGSLSCWNVQEHLMRSFWADECKFPPVFSNKMLHSSCHEFWPFWDTHNHFFPYVSCYVKLFVDFCLRPKKVSCGLVSTESLIFHLGSVLIGILDCLDIFSYPSDPLIILLLFYGLEFNINTEWITSGT